MFDRASPKRLSGTGNAMLLNYNIISKIHNTHYYNTQENS